jgi:hypothetical protein
VQHYPPATPSAAQHSRLICQLQPQRFGKAAARHSAFT